jgi:hypothetical protein
MAEQRSAQYHRGFEEGQEAVRRRPRYAPTNPYDDGTEVDLFEGWEDGAYSAGICDIYTNGILHE